MKKINVKWFLLTLALVFTAFVFFPVDNYGSGDLSESLEGIAKGYAVEDVSAEILSEGTVVYVSGNVRNLRRTSMRGKVTIYMVDGGDGVIHLMEAEVNDQRPIPSGGIGAFEMYENVAGFELAKIENIFIDFVEK